MPQRRTGLPQGRWMMPRGGVAHSRAQGPFRQLDRVSRRKAPDRADGRVASPSPTSSLAGAAAANFLVTLPKGLMNLMQSPIRFLTSAAVRSTGSICGLEGPTLNDFLPLLIFPNSNLRVTVVGC